MMCKAELTQTRAYFVCMCWLSARQAGAGGMQRGVSTVPLGLEEPRICPEAPNEEQRGLAHIRPLLQEAGLSAGAAAVE